MPKRRIAPPLGLPAKPNLARTPDREAEILAEFEKRLEYLLASFRFGLAAQAFNVSLTRLKKTVQRGPSSQGRGERVHPTLEILINIHALRSASSRTGNENSPVTQADVEVAARHVATTLRPERGRPRASLLEHHVAGLMALIHETFGLPVMSSRGKSSDDYNPQLEPGVSKLLMGLRDVDPSITETQLANKVHELRLAYANKTMSFMDLFPLYGARVDPNGSPVFAPPYKMVSFTRCHPIYCP